mmetsp:Transcript_12751/g.27577  ORF Transcript_12751/g.27577 Transcript_12751/m.27577 type:complete len:196 (-) Transcript_12751:1093-1680(-)
MDGHQNVSRRKAAGLLSHQRRRGGRALSTVNYLANRPSLLRSLVPPLFPNARQVNNNNIPITAPTPSLLEEDGAIVGSIEVPGTLLAAGAEATSSMPFQMGAQLPDYFPSAPYALPLLTNQLDGPGNEPPMPPLGLPYNLVDPAQQAFELFQQEINNRTAAAETMAVGMGEPEKEDIGKIIYLFIFACMKSSLKR